MDCRTLWLFALSYISAQDVFQFSGHGRSGDVLTYEGDSFTFYCMGEADGGYLQVLKSVRGFPQYPKWYPRHHPNHIERPIDFGQKIVSTNTELDPSVPSHMVERYNVSHVTRHGVQGVAVHVTNASFSDSGDWACRIGNQNGYDPRVTTDGANITVIAPVVDMKFFEAVDRTMFRSTIEYITDNVTLNAEDPKIFGCQVWLNSGLPHLTGFWLHDPQREEINNTQWTVSRGLSDDHYFGITFDWVIVSNDSGLLWTRTTDIPDVGNRNGKIFSCEAALPFFGTRSITITVFSSTPPVSAAHAAVSQFAVIVIVIVLVAASANSD